MLSITKLQNLKAIHNFVFVAILLEYVVINHKTTKFESDSQQKTTNLNSGYCCYQSQNYKIWKQFTTCTSCPISIVAMLSITKLQNLKAIHNANKPCTEFAQDVINHKTTKFESNSQLFYNRKKQWNCCYQSQNYKIWKQFTTQLRYLYKRAKMLSITKLQNLKAIHNYISFWKLVHFVVINHKTTKFESNSQPASPRGEENIGCYQSQNYKIWKQFTTL